MARDMRLRRSLQAYDFAMESFSTVGVATVITVIAVDTTAGSTRWADLVVNDGIGSFLKSHFVGTAATFSGNWNWYNIGSLVAGAVLSFTDNGILLWRRMTRR